jgi:hypothetical protein
MGGSSGGALSATLIQVPLLPPSGSLGDSLALKQQQRKKEEENMMMHPTVSLLFVVVVVAVVERNQSAGRGTMGAPPPPCAMASTPLYTQTPPSFLLHLRSFVPLGAWASPCHHRVNRIESKLGSPNSVRCVIHTRLDSRQKGILQSLDPTRGE